MTRKNHTQAKVALLATGDEIKNGDILNTNSQEIALRLFSHGIVPGTHMVVGDNTHEIELAIQSLLQNHQALIITGGLGPTSDDLTRQALASSLNKALIFDEASWDTIVQRLKNFGYKTPPDSNKQQALFPEGATIIPNPNGTAAGCIAEENQQWIFMLPGPPMECLPMVNEVVIPILSKNHFQKTFYQRKWLLFGVSEGEIAETLDAIAKPHHCTTGYRICYPYIEFKIYSSNQKDFSNLAPKIHDAVAKFIIDDGKYSASEKLKQLLSTLAFKISIFDHATGGLLESTLLTPETYDKLFFTTDLKNAPPGCHIEIKGLDEFWRSEASKTTHLETIIDGQPFKKEIPLRGIRVKQYAVELVCKKTYEYLLIKHCV